MDQFVAHPEAVGFSADGRYLALARQTVSGVEVSILDVETGALTPLSLGGRDIAGFAWSPTGAALAYLVSNGVGGGDGTMPDGLYLAEPPGAPGRLVAEGPYTPPVCCGIHPIVWASNDTMVLGNSERPDQPFLLRFGR